MAVVAWATPRGLGVTPDSIVYVSVADSLVRGTGFKTFNGDPLLHFAPLLSIFVAGGMSLGLSALTVTKAINLVCIFLLPIMTYGIGRKIGLSTRFSNSAAILALLVPTTLWVHNFLWTEPAFILFCQAAILSAVCYLRSRHRAWIITAIIAVWLAVGMRFIGLSLVPLLFVAYFLANKRPNVFSSVIGAFAVSLIASLPMLVYYALTKVGGYVPFGERGPSQVPAQTVVVDALRGVGSLVVPEAREDLSLTVGIALCLIILALVIQVRPRANVAAGLLGVFVASYLGILVFMQLSSPLEPIGWRYIAPIVPPIVLLSSAGIYNITKATSQGVFRLYSSFLVLLSSGLVLATAVGSPIRTVSFIIQSRELGLVYNGVTWSSECLVDALSSLHSGSRRSSNDAVALYWLTRQRVVTLEDRSDSALVGAVIAGNLDEVIFFGAENIRRNTNIDQLDMDLRTKHFCNGEIVVLWRPS